MRELILKNLDASLYAELLDLAKQQGQDLENYALHLLKSALAQQQQKAALEGSYKAMTVDQAREEEAFEWIEGTLE